MRIGRATMETKSTRTISRGVALTIVAVTLSIASAGTLAMGPVVDRDTGVTLRAPHKLPNEYYHLRKAREAAEFARLEAVAPGDIGAAGSEMAPGRDPARRTRGGAYYRHK